MADQKISELNALTGVNAADDDALAIVDTSATETKKITRAQLFTDTPSIDVSGNITVSGTVDGRDVATDGTKLDGIESGATADQTASEILTAIKTVDGSGSGLDADTLDGFHLAPISNSGEVTSAIPYIKSDSVMEVGRYIDMHTSGSTVDYDVRINCSSADVLQFDGLTNTGLRVGSNTVWHAGNDGSGSGLDADTVDGIEASQFLRSDAVDTATGKITFSGGQEAQAIFKSGATNFDSLKLSGTYSLYNANASGHTNAPFQYGAMITAGNTAESGGMAMQIAHERTGVGTYIRGMNDTNDTWYDWEEIWTSGTDGSGSGLDADTVDGIEASSFLRSDADDSTSSTITFSNDIVVGDQIIHDGDTDTYMQFDAGDSWRVVVGGGEKLSTATNGITITSASGYATFGSSNSSWFHMSTDRPNFYMAQGLRVNGTLGVYNQNTYLTSDDIYLNGILYHYGDTDTYMQFHNANQWRVVTGGTERLEVTDSNVTVNTGLKLNKEVTENVTALSGTSDVLEPQEGTIRTHTLSGNTTYTESFLGGQSMTLMIDDGAGYTVTWPTMTWVNNGGSAPTLATSGYTVIVLWKALTGGTLYGALVGDGS